jgi:hypothetical protein
MATINTTDKNPARSGRFPDPARLQISYDKKADIFCFRDSDAQDWVANDCDGEFFVLTDPKNGDVIGILVEDFERIFLKKHPELLSAWTQAHARPWGKWSRSVQNGLTRVFIGFFDRRFPQQKLILPNA